MSKRIVKKRRNNTQQSNFKKDELSQQGDVNQLKIKYWDNMKERICHVPGLGIPDRMFVNLPYDIIQLALISAGLTGVQVMAGNSVYDPDQTGAGHQPLYYDQLATLYKWYRVHASTISVSVLSSTIGVTLAVTPTTHFSYPQGINDAMEYPYTSYANVPTSMQFTSIGAEISTKKIWGMKSIDQDDLFASAYNTNPSRVNYWRVQAAVADGVTNGTLRVNIRVVYHVELFTRFEVTQS